MKKSWRTFPLLGARLGSPAAARYPMPSRYLAAARETTWLQPPPKETGHSALGQHVSHLSSEPVSSPSFGLGPPGGNPLSRVAPPRTCVIYAGARVCGRPGDELTAPRLSCAALRGHLSFVVPRPLPGEGTGGLEHPTWRPRAAAAPRAPHRARAWACARLLDTFPVSLPENDCR